MQCLIVTSDPVVGFLVEQAAAKLGCESQTVASPTEALDLAKRNEAEVVVVDHAPPALDATAWCAVLRREEDARTTRVIVLAPPDDPFDVTRMNDIGIDDLLVKPFQAVELELKLLASQQIRELGEQLKAARRALEARSTYDPLTGVLNEKSIVAALRREADRAGRDGTPLSVMTIEVDGLGIIRDWTGADAADAALIDVAARVQSGLRPYDSVGRSGDAAFLAALPRCDLDRAVAVAQRIVASVSGTPVRGGGRMLSVTVSVGVARLATDDAGRPDRVVAASVTALVAARAAGGNRVATPAGPA
jgi:diguanylate cyclase (GGDEF)-like protein